MEATIIRQATAAGPFTVSKQPLNAADYQAQLRAMRKAAKMTQEDVAFALLERGVECTSRAVGHWETAARQIDWRVMVALLDVYGRKVVVK